MPPLLRREVEGLAMIKEEAEQALTVIRDNIKDIRDILPCCITVKSSLSHRKIDEYDR